MEKQGEKPESKHTEKIWPATSIVVDGSIVLQVIHAYGLDEHKAQYSAAKLLRAKYYLDVARERAGDIFDLLCSYPEDDTKKALINIADLISLEEADEISRKEINCENKWQGLVHISFGNIMIWLSTDKYVYINPTAQAVVMAKKCLIGASIELDKAFNILCQMSLSLDQPSQ